MITKSPILSMLKFWPDPHLFKSPGPKTPFWACIVTLYNFGLLAQSITQSENNFLGPNLLLGLFVTFYKIAPYGPVSIHSENNFLGPIPISGSSRSKTIFGPVLDFGLNLIEAQQPLENPNN